MTTMNLLANVNVADLIAYAKAVPTPSDYLLTQSILPQIERNTVKWRIKSTTRYQSAAKFRAFDAETPLGQRRVDVATSEGMLPPVGQKLTVGELETILLAMERGADDTELVDALYDDTENNVRAIRARMELAAGDLLTDGKFTLANENGLTLEADFEVPAGFLPVAAVLWSDANATPITDERAWIRKLVTEGEGRPTRAITSDLVVGILATNMEYKEAYFGRGQDSYPTLTPGQVDSVRQSSGLPPITIYETTVRVDDVVTRVLPENRFFLVTSPETLGETQYGITAEALALQRNGNPRIAKKDLPGIIVTVREQDDPVRVWTKGSAVAMPLLQSPKAYVGARVLA